jgi:prevent-host-death family protein
MKSVGIREAKARLSELSRAAASGDATIITDYGKPVAVIGPIVETIKEESASDAGEFREALLSLPVVRYGFETPDCACSGGQG